MWKRTAVLLILLATAVAAQDRWWDLMRQGAAFERAGQYAAAVERYEAARAEDLEPRQAVLTCNALAGAYAERGEFAKALHEYERALASTEAQSADRGVVLGSLASLHVEMGRKAKGERLLRESLGILEGALPANDERFARARNNLAELLIEQRQYAEAESLLREALPVFEAGNDHAALGIVLNNLGLSSLHQQRTSIAIDAFRRALAAFDEGLTPDHPYAARIWNNLATACTRAGRTAEAEDAFEHGLRIAESRLGAGHPLYASLLRNYAAFARRNGRKDARELTDRANAVTREQSLRSGTYSTVDVSAFTNGRVVR